LLFIAGGVFALGLGADMIVRSSINLANTYKISGYFIGFTVVALGTSLPELAATVQALNIVDSVDIALGNIIGSNVANLLLILGVVSIINPITFSQERGQKNQTLIVLVVTLIATAIFYFLSNNQNSNSIFLGVILVTIFFVFLFLQYRMELADQSNASKTPNYSQFVSYLLLIIGLVFLYFGSKYFIIGSQKLAISFNISETIIGLTLVAFGTSLPELATGIIAALRKQSSLAVGTILGSNVYNIVGIFALILFMKSGEFPAGSGVLMTNIIIMTIITFLFVYKVRFGVKLLNIKAFQLTKNSGISFLILYAIYTLYNYLKLN
jgi:cation:H+ antiporter